MVIVRILLIALILGEKLLQTFINFAGLLYKMLMTLSYVPN